MAEDARTERTAAFDEPSARSGRRRERWPRLGRAARASEAGGDREALRPAHVWGEERPEESHAEPEKCSRKVYHGCFGTFMMYGNGLDR